MGRQSRKDTLLAGCTACYAAVLCLLLSAIIAPAAGMAQSQDDRLDIGGIEHTVVDGQHVVLVRLDNASLEEISASGMLAVVDAGGLELERVSVETGRLVPDGPSVLAVPLVEPLGPGAYNVSLVLSVEPDGPPVHSGPRGILVDQGAGTAPGRQPTGTMLQADNGDGGFPSWMLLMAGLALVTIGFTLRRETGRKRKTQMVPAVSMVRKVKLDSRPPKRPATIKPLRPPDRRRRS